MTFGPSQQRAGDAHSDRALLDLEYLVVWVVALAVVAGIGGAIAFYGDDVRDTTPDAAFAVSFDTNDRAVTVVHNGGDAVRDRVTSRLSIVVVDGDTNASERIDWASDDAPFSDRGSGYPVAEGDALTIDDPTVDADGDGSVHDGDATVGFELTTDDEVRVEWSGVRRGGQSTTATLRNVTLGQVDDAEVRAAATRSRAESRSPGD